MGPIATVTANGASVPYVRYGTVQSAGVVPASSQHYYDFSGEGLGPVIDVVRVATSAPLTISVTFAATGLTSKAMSGVYGATASANIAKQNVDLDRTTPGSESVGPAYCSVLASTGDALA